MARKKRRQLKDPLPRRKKLPLRGKSKLPLRKKSKPATSKPFKFTKTKVAALKHPAKGKREIYRDTDTPHLCLRVTPSAKTFYWEGTVWGAQKRITIGRFPAINVVLARKQAAGITADYTKGVDVQEARSTKRSEGTFGDLWEDYKENRPRKREGVESKALNYQWDRHFKKWKNKRLSEITYEGAFRLIKGIRKNAKFYANRVQRQGKAMFNFAKRDRKWRWEGENPFDFNYVSEKGRVRTVRLEPKDMPAFMEGLAACSPTMRLLFLTSLYTGRRMGEVQAMRWEDVDLDTGVWTIPETKSGVPQEAMMPSVLVDELTAHGDTADSPWVFPSPSKTGHVEQIQKAWREVRKVSGLEHLQARDLRRTLASWAQEANAPIAVVQAQLGHADIATTAKHYTSITRDVIRAALDDTVASMIAAAK